MSSGTYPGRALIDAYGGGGFRFAGMSHRGSILCTTAQIRALDACTPQDLACEALRLLLADADKPIALLLGTGRKQVFMPAEIRRKFVDAGMALDPMDTGAAARTYNVLLAEGRPVAAALLAVD